MLSRIGRTRGDGGSGFVQYVALAALAGLILAGLVTVGIGTKLGDGVQTVICQITGGDHCDKSGGRDNAGGDHGGDHGGDNGGNNGGDNGQNTAAPSPGSSNGDVPSLADLQKQADDAQRNLDGASDGGGILDKIVDLLKDFIGITDVQKCFGDGDIASCLWAAFDVGSLVFAALKIGKFVKAVKDAVKLYRDFKDAKRAYEGFKTALSTSKSRLKRVAEQCGVPLYGASFAAGTRVALAGGGTEPIQDVRVGDRVLAGGPGGAPRGERVLALIRGHGPREFVRLRVAGNAYGIGGGSVTVAANHLFWSPGRHAWVEAGDLRVNERFATSGGLTPRVVRSEAFRDSRPVFNLTVAGPHTYYVSAGGPLMLVHNAEDCGPAWAKVSGTVRDAAKGKGNFGLGSGTRQEAESAGRAWVGPDAKLASDGKTWVSKDGLRQYRPPSEKPKLGKTQANFEQRNEPKGQWQGNGHLDITD